MDPAELLDVFASEEYVWGESLTPAREAALVRWVGTQLQLNEAHQEALSASVAVTEATGGCSTVPLVCPHLRDAHRQHTWMQQLLEHATFQVVVEDQRPADDDFLCSALCSYCKAEDELGWRSDATPSPDAPGRDGGCSVAHAHCVACVASHLSRSQRNEAFDDGVCVWHIVAHHSSNKAVADRIMDFLDDNDDAHADDLDDVPTIDGRPLTSFSTSDDADMARLDAEAKASLAHGVFVIATGSSTLPALVAYCAECQLFGPLCPSGYTKEPAVVGHGDDAASWSSKQSAARVFMNTLLAASILMADGADGRAAKASQQWKRTPEGASTAMDGGPPMAASLLPRRCVFLYRAVYFQDDQHNEALEADVVATWTDVWLPNASVDNGCLMMPPPVAPGPTNNNRAQGSLTFQADTAVGGYLLQFEGIDTAAQRVAELQAFHPWLKATVSSVFVSETGQWVEAYVLFFGSDALGQPELCPLEEDDVITAVDKYFPCWATEAEVRDDATSILAACVLDPPSQDSTNRRLEADDADRNHRCHCPLTAVSRNVNLWLSMTHLALMVRRLSIGGSTPHDAQPSEPASA